VDQFIQSLPKTVLALLAIVIGFLLIIYFNPPHTVCDAQLDLFRESQRTFLYAATEKGFVRPPEIKHLYNTCQEDNSPGSCFEYFEKLKKLTTDLVNIPRECSATAAGETEISSWLWQSLKLMTQIAWGPKAPQSYLDKHSWFDASDVSLFCELKQNATRIFGEEKFAAWRETTMKELPQADKLSREQVWSKTILSTACDSYR
jgi:hypothetical protein